MYFKRLFLSIISLLLTLYLLNAQILINEYSCSNVSTITDNYGEYEDWIELYNNKANTVNL